MSTLFGDDDAGVQSSEQQRTLVDAYVTIGRTLDDLPYTQEWAALMAITVPVLGDTFNNRRVFHSLQNLRKRSLLPRVGRSGVSAVKVTPEEETLVMELLKKYTGTVGQRDRLPFTQEFDLLAHELNQLSGRGLEPHEVWRLICKVAK